jgi:Bacteriophage tail sheath protein
MPEYLSPGVYVEEYEIGPKPIEGVSTSTAGFLGETARGPITPKFLTSFEDYKRFYGGFTEDSYLAYAVDGFFRNGGQRCFVARIAGKTGSQASGKFETDIGLTANAVGPGKWGNRISVTLAQGSLFSDKNPGLFKIILQYWNKDLTEIDKSKDEPLVHEVFDNLTGDPLSIDNYEKRVNGVSNFITFSGELNDSKLKIALKPAAASTSGDSSGTAAADTSSTTAEVSGSLKDGTDKAVTLTDYQGEEDKENGSTGLAAFAEIDEIAILCAPDENNGALVGLTGELVAHCEMMKDRFAILQASASVTDIAQFYPPKDSRFAAIYYPWIKIVDPLTQKLKLIPPGGHMAGIYARTDTERGVHKAPANEVVRGVTALQFPVTKAAQDMLNPRGINCIRSFVGRGIRVWGARTISSDPLWKYINVRRLFNFLEESIEEGTQWVVFEPNDAKLWARVKQTVSQFLTTQWRSGSLMGNAPEEAFFVKCDRTTMTQDDIDNGRLIVMIGVAPVKPAEFVVFRIAQWQGGSTATE